MPAFQSAIAIPGYNPGGQAVITDAADPAMSSTTVPIVHYRIPIATWPLLFLFFGYLLLRYVSGDSE